MEPVHDSRERLFNLVEFGGQDTGFDIDDKIVAERFVQSVLIILSDDLPDPALASIADHSASYFPGHGDSMTVLAGFSLQYEKRKISCFKLFSQIIDLAELLIVSEGHRFVGRSHYSKWILVMARRQSFAAFGAAAFENQATGPSAHALAESMCFRASTVIWLKCTLHQPSP
jgi:hypothetical protein